MQGPFPFPNLRKGPGIEVANVYVNAPISLPEPAIPWEENGGSGIIRDRHTKNCMNKDEGKKLAYKGHSKRRLWDNP